MDLSPPSEISHPEHSPESSSFLQPDQLEASLEALLFITDKPLSLERLRALFELSEESQILEARLHQLQKRYLENWHGIELLEVAGGYQFRTKTNYAFLAKKLVKVQTQRLSSAAMECLASLLISNRKGRSKLIKF
jgi:segregation and condensation protein B